MLKNNLGLSVSVLSFGSIYAHPSLMAMSGRYTRIRDCLNNNVKAKRYTYLPDPSEVREEQEIRNHRYNNYHARAVWLPATKRTQQGLVGQVFTHKATFVDKEKLNAEFIAAPSVNGDTIDGIANYALSEVVAMGRGAFTSWFTSASKPVIDFIEAENIVSWAELPYGTVDALGRNIQSVTLRTFTNGIKADGITVEMVATLTQYKLDTLGDVWMRTLVETLGTHNSGWGAWSRVTINNAPLKYCPVFIVGSERNTLDVQQPPLEELAELNLSHYINSADYEEHVKVAGQVTTVISGLDQAWYDKNIEGKVAFGVRKPIPLNSGAKASLLQANANSVAKEALDKKEQMMIAVGARLIEQRQVRRTATEADIEAQSYHSILGHIAINVSTALSQCLRHVATYYEESADVSTLEYRLNSSFGTSTDNAEHRRLLLEEYIAGVRSFVEYRTALARYDETLSTDSEKAKKEIEEDLVLREKVAKIGATLKAKGDTNPDDNGGDNRTKSQPNKQD